MFQNFINDVPSAASGDAVVVLVRVAVLVGRNGHGLDGGDRVVVLLFYIFSKRN